MSRSALRWRRLRFGWPLGLHRWAGALALALTLLGGWLLLSPSSEAPAPALATSAQALWSAGPPGVGVPLPPQVPVASSPLAWSGALPGDWAMNAEGHLQPSFGLRERFDHVLTQRGERSLAHMRTELQQRAELALGVPAAQEVLTLWDRYIRLQLWPWKSEVDLHRPATWRAALAERVRVRRDLLGPDWAQAFYGREEQDLRRWIASRAGPEAAPLAATPDLSPPIDREAEWQRWEQRLAQSRALLDRLQAAPRLSDEERRLALAQHLDSHYQGSERQRAQAVLLSGAK